MSKILEILNKWGMLMLIVLGILIFFNTCGTGGNIDRTNRRLDKIEKAMQSIDSTAATKVSEQEMEVMLEIVSLETARRVVYDNNTIVRTTKRPDDVMNEYDQKIKELRKKLQSLKK